MVLPNLCGILDYESFCWLRDFNRGKLTHICSHLLIIVAEIKIIEKENSDGSILDHCFNRNHFLAGWFWGVSSDIKPAAGGRWGFERNKRNLAGQQY